MQISAVIIAGNEEEKIGDAIRSAVWADEVVVVDSESTDTTREIAEGLGARVIVKPWAGFSAQKQFAVDEAKHDWILSLDADERVSPALKEEIQQLQTKGESELPLGFRIPRLSYYIERPVRHSGWYPDWQLRLFDRRAGRWSSDLIHESFRLDGDATPGKLQNDIIHLTVDSAAKHHRMIGERYAPLAAQQMFASGRRTSKLRIVTAGSIAFLSTYILKAGFLDGFTGYCIARFAAHHAFLKHLLLWELQNKERTEPDTTH
jgi:glycosyltransferase involved in cell wall biosynthesis